MISDVPRPKLAAEMVSGDMSALKPTIDEIHDHSEQENDSPNKTSIKNVLYEKGK